MTPGAVQHAKWSVMWKGKKGYMAEKKFDNDFQAALDAYTLLKQAGKKWVTLRCLNAGFAPPRSITHSPVASYEVVTRRGKKYKKKVITETNLMEEHNSHGIWWCPYCVQLREFYKDTEELHKLTMRCPVCEVSNRDFHVRRWNPEAQLMEYRQQRRPSGTRRRNR